jgi:hypothetical protein
MPTYTFNVKLFHAPGPGGLNKPLAGATVQVVDIDLPGKQDDVIWQGTTNADGVVSGTTGNWQDKITVPGPFPITMPDPTDVPIFKLRVKLGSSSWDGPLPLGPASVQLPVVTSIPAALPLGKVNGKEYSTLDGIAMSNDIHDRVEARDHSISIEIYGPVAVMFSPLAAPYNELKTWVRSRLPYAANPASRFGNSPEAAFWTLVGVSLIIAVSGASAIGILLGLALIFAIYRGYGQIAMSYEVKNIGGLPVPAMTISLKRNS